MTPASVRAYEREKVRAPRFVANELAGTIQAAGQHRQTAALRVLAEAAAETDAERRAPNPRPHGPARLLHTEPQRRRAWSTAAHLASKLDYGRVKTTLDLPDDLMRAVKIRAAQENRKLKDLVADLLRRGLAQRGETLAGGARVRLPLVQTAHAANPDAQMNPDRVAQVLLDEEAQRASGA